MQSRSLCQKEQSTRFFTSYAFSHTSSSFPKNWRKTVHYQPEQAQHIHQGTKISHVKSFGTCFYAQSPGMVDFHRSQGRVLPYRYQTYAPQIPRLSSRGLCIFFRGLPFGFNVAPYIFTWVLRYSLALLHQQRIAVLSYLDDWVVWGTTLDQTCTAYASTIHTLHRLWFHINKAKSQPIPATDIDWLGVR